MLAELDAQSTVLPGAESVPGETLPQVRAGVTALPATSRDGSANLYDLFARSADRHATRPCLGRRVAAADGSPGPFEFIDYAEALRSVRVIGSGLRLLGASANSTLGLWSSNRIEWMLTALGAFSQSVVVVPMYDTLGDDAMVYELNHAEVSIVVLERAKLAKLGALLATCPAVRSVVQIEPRVDADLSKGRRGHRRTAHGQPFHSCSIRLSTQARRPSRSSALVASGY